MSAERADCIFCRIIKGDLKSDKVFEDDRVIVIKDIKPKAPTHLLIMPKVHIENVAELNSKHESLAGHLLLVAGDMARKSGVDKKGFRLQLNNGEGAGQEVPHLHIHLLG